MKSKAAVQVERGGPLVIDEIDIPDPGPNQVTVRNFASGVCYSQVHQLRSPGLPRPMGLGHEGSGIVGAPTTALQILRAVREGGPRADNRGGMAVLLGIPVSEVSFDLNAILLYQRQYCGSLGASSGSPR